MRLKNSVLGINGKDISVNGDCTYVQQLYNHKRGPHALSRGYVISLVPISVLLVSGPDLLRPESNIRVTGLYFSLHAQLPKESVYCPCLPDSSI